MRELNTAPRELHFDLATKSILLNGAIISKGPRVSRVFQILLILYGFAGRSFTVAELSRLLVSAPSDRQIRRVLSVLDTDFSLVGNDGYGWRARPPEQVRVSPSPPRLLEWFDVTRFSQFSGARGQFESPDQLIIRAEHLKQTGDLESLVALLRPRVRSIEQASSTQRPRRLTMAYTLLSEAFMAFGDYKVALAHGERARMWIDRITTKRGEVGPTDVLIRVLATEAATHRIAAAIVSVTDNVAARNHLMQAESKYDQAMFALHSCADLPGELMDERNRWMYASSTTPMVLRHEVQSASRNLDEAEKLAARVRSDGAEFGETWLLRARQLIAIADFASARTKVDEVETFINSRATPHWLRAWLPIYQASLAFALRQPRDEIRHFLLAAWNVPTQAPFQRLRILARFASWDIEPGRDAIEEREEIAAFLREWHPRLTGESNGSCSTCQNPPTGWQLLPRIRCAMRMGRGDSLGLWE